MAKQAVSTTTSFFTTTLAQATELSLSDGNVYTTDVVSQPIVEIVFKNGGTSTSYLPLILPTPTSVHWATPTPTQDHTTTTSPSEKTGTTGSKSDTESNSSISTGVKVAIAVCAVLAVLIVIIAGYFLRRRKIRSARASETPPPIPMSSKPSFSRIKGGRKVGELDSTPIHELEEGERTLPIHELHEGQGRAELPA